MKKFIRWLAEVFNANIIVTIHEDRIVYKPFNEYVGGDLEIDGDLKVRGNLYVTKDIICYKLKQENYDTTK